MPTALDRATPYLLWSESGQSRTVRFTDSASGKPLAVDSPAVRAALVLVTHQTQIAARYDPAPSVTTH